MLVSDLVSHEHHSGSFPETKEIFFLNQGYSINPQIDIHFK